MRNEIQRQPHFDGKLRQSMRWVIKGKADINAKVPFSKDQ